MKKKLNDLSDVQFFKSACNKFHNLIEEGIEEFVYAIVLQKGIT